MLVAHDVASEISSQAQDVREFAELVKHLVVHAVHAGRLLPLVSLRRVVPRSVLQAGEARVGHRQQPVAALLVPRVLLPHGRGVRVRYEVARRSRVLPTVDDCGD